MWLGYLEEYPDYWTQGETQGELQENLLDIYKDLSSGAVPHVRRVAELKVGRDLVKQLESMGCEFVRHGGKHDWYRNPQTKVSQAVPRHRESIASS